ncbi:MAG: hypothetical protein Q4F27_03950 [Desulfovibrionaceae bacterium]|nr:hypothetical protein [Desulfovibrionaceae bacterium]
MASFWQAIRHQSARLQQATDKIALCHECCNPRKDMKPQNDAKFLED